MSDFKVDFKVGDRVVCIDDDMAYGFLQSGREYTVDQTEDVDGDVFISVIPEGGTRRNYHRQSRFKLVHRSENLISDFDAGRERYRVVQISDNAFDVFCNSKKVQTSISGADLGRYLSNIIVKLGYKD